MQEMFQGFLDIDNIFWGENVYRWWFFLTILIILFLEKRRTIKILFSWFSILFLIGMFNPLSNWIMSIIAPAWQYRARLYSMLPIPYALGLGTILVMERVCKINNTETTRTGTEEIRYYSAIKMVIVVGTCLLIVLCGTDIYKQDWMNQAQNIEKVPNAILELKEKIGNQVNICVAVPDSLSSYVRQIMPSVYTPYGRHLDSLGNGLSSSNPDPKYVMTEAGAESCDYIVIYDNEINIESFRKNGFEIYDRITGYLIYKVTGVPFTKREYNERRQVTKITYFDENKNLIENNLGYAGIIYEYDNEGNRSKEIYLDQNGKRKTLEKGYSGIKRTYMHLTGLVASIIYLDDNDGPVLIDGCYETRIKYNKDRRIKEESYFDANGYPMNRTDYSFASNTATYDEKGRLIRETYYDINGERVLSSLGYASYSREYDNNNRIIRETYYGTDGLPIKTPEGYAIIVREYADDGLQSSETYLDENGKPIIRNTGYARVCWEYNEQGNLIQETYWDADGNPAVNKRNRHGVILGYDEEGNISTVKYIDTEGAMLE